MKHSTLSILVLLVLLVLVSSCASTRYPSPYPYPRTEDEKDHRKGEDGRSYPFGDLGIPKGHLPPPGECKVWFPGKPAGHQPPPQSCASAMRSAPLGAWVITHEGSRYRVNIFSRTVRDVIEEVRFYTTQ